MILLKRKRPRQHIRKLRRSWGYKYIVINRGLLKKRKGIISKNERKIFTHMSNPRIHKTEFGGSIDWNLDGRIDNFTVLPGQKYGVEIDEDYEAQYHTHPFAFQNPPSPEDVVAFVTNKHQQAEIIIRDGQIFTIIKTPKTKALSKLPATTLLKKFRKALLSSKNSPYWEDDVKRALEKFGFKVDINNKINQKYVLDITPVEPKKKRKVRKWV